MHLLHFETRTSKNLNAFIAYWSQLYSYSNELVYKNAIAKTTFDIEDIQDLYVWKNGMRLSELKQKSLEQNIISKLPIINWFKNNEEFDLDSFRKEFNNLSTVWKIFLLHIIKPNQYPIYDQHIHRAFLFIHKKDYTNVSNTTIKNKDKEVFYFKEYLSFIESSNIKDIKKLDEAFFAFGQFLNTKNYSNLFKTI